uniref:TFIID_NTD2 domain-containing protein n=1 Tax=Panagrellus redivivus TaxID=6233 RepID=A0A7E4VG57_PANRE
MADGAATAAASTGTLVNGFTDPSQYATAMQPVYLTTAPVNDAPATSEASNGISAEDLNKVFAILRKGNLKLTEEQIYKELGLQSAASGSTPNGVVDGGSAEGSAPFDYNDMFAQLNNVINMMPTLFETQRNELSTVIFPILFHLYVKIIKAGNLSMAKLLLRQNINLIPSFHFMHLDLLKTITTTGQLVNCDTLQPYLDHKFCVRFSKALNKQFETLLAHNPIIQAIVKDHIKIDVVDPPPNDIRSLDFYAGGIGQAASNKKEKIFFGVNREDVVIVGDKKKKKDAKDLKKKDVMAPPPDRVLFPALPEAVIEDRKNAYRECGRKGKVTWDNPPSIALFTILNSNGNVACASFNENPSVVAFGLSDGRAQIRALDKDGKLKKVKSYQHLKQYTDADINDLDVEPYTDPKETEGVVTFHSHESDVTSVAFTPDRRSFLSSSTDRTVRLFHLDTQKEIAFYRHFNAVNRMVVCSRGLYFASSAGLRFHIWSQERGHPLRTYSDALGAQMALDWHPNGNYVLGGSEDRFVRLWDIAMPHCARTFVGHKTGIRGCKVSPDGRHAVSVSEDGAVCVWDIGQQKLAATATVEPVVHKVPIEFQRDGGFFAIGAPHHGISFFCMDSLLSGDTTEAPDHVHRFDSFSYQTKRTPLFDIQFGKRNSVYALGALQHP